MKLSYDPNHNIAYIRLREIETLRISDELNVDMAPDGTVYGIELLNANEQLTVPIGAFVGKNIAGQKISFQSGPRWYVEGPDTAPD